MRDLPLARVITAAILRRRPACRPPRAAAAAVSTGAGAGAAAAATPAEAVRSTSATVIVPPGPLPLSAARSTPSSAALRRARGAARAVRRLCAGLQCGLDVGAGQGPGPLRGRRGGGRCDGGRPRTRGRGLDPGQRRADGDALTRGHEQGVDDPVLENLGVDRRLLGLDAGATTLRPGMCAYQPSRLWECCAATWRPAPVAMRTTRGTLSRPPDMCSSVASLFMSWSSASRLTFTVMISTIGRIPARAAPMPAPTKADSESTCRVRVRGRTPRAARG